MYIDGPTEAEQIISWGAREPSNYLFVLVFFWGVVHGHLSSEFWCISIHRGTLSGDFLK